MDRTFHETRTISMAQDFSWSFLIGVKESCATLLAMGASGGVKSPQVSETSIVPAEPVKTRRFRVRLKSRRTVSKKLAKAESIREQRKGAASNMKDHQDHKESVLSVLSPLLESETEGEGECEIDIEQCQLYHPCSVPPPDASTWFQWRENSSAYGAESFQRFGEHKAPRR